MLPYQNLRTTEGFQVRILVEMGFEIKFLLFFLAYNFIFRFHLQILVSSSIKKREDYLPGNILPQYFEYPE